MKVLKICSFFWNSKTTPKSIRMVFLGERWLLFCVTLWNVKWERYYVVRYISIFFNEVFTIDNTSWIKIHAYVLEKWKHVLILFTLEKVTSSVITTNLTCVLLCALFSFGGMNEQVVGQKLELFGIDGGSMFIGVRNGITT